MSLPVYVRHICIRNIASKLNRVLFASKLNRVLAQCFLALGVLIANSTLGMATTITMGTDGQINWTQTQNFDLNGLLPAMCYGSHGSGSGCSENRQQSVSMNESTTVSFTGAPSGFTIADTQYSLTGVSLNILYSAAFSAAYPGGGIRCQGQDLGRACDANATIASAGSVAFSNGPSASIYTLSESGNVNGSGWDFFVIYYPVYAKGYSPLNGSKQNQTFATNYDSNLSYFESQNTLIFELRKSLTGSLYNNVWQDYDDSLQESSDSWSGSVTLGYTYSPVSKYGPVSTPEPSTLLALSTGLTALGVVRRKHQFLKRCGLMRFK